MFIVNQLKLADESWGVTSFIKMKEKSYVIIYLTEVNFDTLIYFCFAIMSYSLYLDILKLFVIASAIESGSWTSLIVPFKQ